MCGGGCDVWSVCGVGVWMNGDGIRCCQPCMHYVSSAQRCQCQPLAVGVLVSLPFIQWAGVTHSLYDGTSASVSRRIRQPLHPFFALSAACLPFSSLHTQHTKMNDDQRQFTTPALAASQQQHLSVHTSHHITHTHALHAAAVAAAPTLFDNTAFYPREPQLQHQCTSSSNTTALAARRVRKA